MLINTQFHLSNLLGLSHGWTIPIYFIYTELLVWASYSDTNYLSEHPNSHTNYLSEHLHSDTGVILIVARNLLIVCMVDPTQMCPSSILPLGLFQGIIGNIERLKEETLESWTTGRTLDPSSYSIHAREMLFASHFLWKREKFVENVCLAAIS